MIHARVRSLSNKVVEASGEVDDEGRKKLGLSSSNFPTRGLYLNWVGFGVH